MVRYTLGMPFSPVTLTAEEEALRLEVRQFLARERQVTICVDLEEPPYAFVQVQGDAELSNDPSELLRTATAIAARYMGPDRADEFGQRNGVPGELVVRVRPTKVLASFDGSG